MSRRQQTEIKSDEIPHIWIRPQQSLYTQYYCEVQCDCTSFTQLSQLGLTYEVTQGEAVNLVVQKSGPVEHSIAFRYSVLDLLIKNGPLQQV